MKTARIVIAALFVVGLLAARSPSARAQAAAGAGIDGGGIDLDGLAVSNISGDAIVADFRNGLENFEASVTNGDVLSRAEAFAAYRARRQARSRRARELRAQQYRQRSSFTYNPGFHVPQLFYQHLNIDPFSGLATGPSLRNFQRSR